jgi:hypothetical protein
MVASAMRKQLVRSGVAAMTWWSARSSRCIRISILTMLMTNPNAARLKVAVAAVDDDGWGWGGVGVGVSGEAAVD